MRPRRLRKDERGLLQHLTALQRFAPVFPSGWYYRNPGDLLLTHGEWYRDARAIPWKQAIPQACFRNAAMYACNQGLRYVEGYALRIIPVHHGWCIDAHNRVLDPTWDTPGSAYFGVVFLPMAVLHGSALWNERNLKLYKKPLTPCTLPA